MCLCVCLCGLLKLVLIKFVADNREDNFYMGICWGHACTKSTFWPYTTFLTSLEQSPILEYKARHFVNYQQTAKSIIFLTDDNGTIAYSGDPFTRT